MPRSVKLTWVPGAKDSGRAGRWRKKYKGEYYYFSGGRGKTDREAYDAAVAAWEEEKIKIDRDAPRPHQRDHEKAIDQWEQVLAWCNRHGDREHAEIAARKLESLRKRLAAPILSKLDREDWFEALFDMPQAADPEWLSILEIMVAEHDQSLATSDVLVSVPRLPGPSVLASPLPDSVLVINPEEELNGTAPHIRKEVWRDRIEIQQRRAVSDDQSLRAYVERYLKDKEHQAAAGEVTVGRHYALKLHLTHFQDWLGKDTAVGEIDGDSLMKYRAGLLDKVVSNEWGRTTAAHYMTSVKSFVRWLWQIEAIPTLPRILDGRSTVLTISRPSTAVVTFTKDEIKTLLGKASDRTKLYILLMLNCGMTQKDISDLLISEVDWEDGRIVRKRSKTSDEENVPVVNYLLWPETIRLLRQERSADSEGLVLLNFNGSPLLFEELTGEGRYKKTDNVKNAFFRLCKEAGITKPLKSLKKTSSTLLRDNEKFTGLEGLFLGHAPQSMSDKHYSKVPQTLLDQAVTWLGQEYGLIECPTPTTPEKPEAQPSDPSPAPEPDAAQPAVNQGPSRAGRPSKTAKVRPAASRRSKAKSVPGP